MRTLRSHVLSVGAVLLALATGIALGSGPLSQPEGDDAPAAAVADPDPGLEETLSRQRAALAYDDAVATATAGSVLAGTLRGRTVTLLLLPGADDEAVSRVAAMLDRAGAELTRQVVVSRDLLDVSTRQLVTELADQVQKSTGAAPEVGARASGYERTGALLARATVTDAPRGEPVDEDADRIVAAWETAGLARVSGNRRGSLVVAVAGEPYGGADERAGAASILGALLRALARSSDAVVLAGPPSAGADDGLLGPLRDDPLLARRIATVDTVDRAAGALAAVRALDLAATGRVGHYGSAGAADGPWPRAR